MSLERVSAFLKKYDENLEPIVLQEEAHTSEAAARLLGVETAQIAKSILFKCNDEFGLFVAAGDVRVDQKKVKQQLGAGKVKMASAEEVLEKTGFEPGAVCPYALATKLPIYLDESLSRFDTVYTAAGIPESVLAINLTKLAELTGGRIINLQK
ncbi:YbaK/EbsC family protein [Fictibacillus iocasae]|uniref:YbaK/EbsC family protein n=1 Tax=Fictibacillus iocasae TaxID=2715437 RepID=A0ABW2NR83_9BACL